jgi:hypothetical protein
MDETYFVTNLKRMIDKGGNNMTTGMKILGELKGLGKKTNDNNAGLLAKFGAGNLTISVQENRRINTRSIESTEFTELENE